MSEEMEFRFSIHALPEGDILTASEVEKHLLEALEAADGKCVDSLWNLAVLYSQSGKYDQAADRLQRFMELTDDPERLGLCHLTLGQFEEKKGDFHAAVKRYRRAVAVEPCSSRTSYFIHNNLGYSLNQIGEHESAVPHLKTALRIDPGRPNAYKNLALSFSALGEFEEAAELLITATQANAADPRALRHLESLVETHPSLLVKMPNLRDRLEACRKAVDVARSQQPDLRSHWEKARRAQGRR